jgi:hypothetical protein
VTRLDELTALPDDELSALAVDLLCSTPRDRVAGLVMMLEERPRERRGSHVDDDGRA